ncbi:MAG: ABC transporter ATP-binding protein [Treponema sp.]|jgi:ABC-type nitrate/sulfonate/bicarbonate transport system ATPase subunit|nr:ABC transporter ATP-binding protein [Treponema sp.]
MNGALNGPVFACEHITKCYLGEPVVRDISLALERGGIISLLGPSGVGKTTLFNVLAGVDLPDEGRIFLEGADITGLSGRVSYMMQKDLLMEYRSVLDNVILPLLLRGEKKKRAREKAAAFFPRFGLGGCEKKYPRQLSGGMRQRAALLRTCVAHGLDGARAGAAVILLDEPFSALDALTRADMREWFLEIARSLGLSAICITHDVDEAITLSGSVYLLNGRPALLGRRFGIDGTDGAERARIKNEILAAVREGQVTAPHHPAYYR